MQVHTCIFYGASPSGKATDSDSVIREFKSLCPNQTKNNQFTGCFFAFATVCRREICLLPCNKCALPTTPVPEVRAVIISAQPNQKQPIHWLFFCFYNRLPQRDLFV